MSEKTSITTLEPMTVRGLVRSAGWNAGHTNWMTDNEVDYILWEHTGFPAFWDDEPEACINRDVTALIVEGPACARCGVRPTDTWMCDRCGRLTEEEDRHDRKG